MCRGFLLLAIVQVCDISHLRLRFGVHISVFTVYSSDIKLSSHITPDWMGHVRNGLLPSEQLFEKYIKNIICLQKKVYMHIFSPVVYTKMF